MKNLYTFIIISIISLPVFSQINNQHLEVGEKAPLITGTDQFGKNINSQEIVKDQKVLLVFYRGNWCPYCRKHLRSLQENLEVLSNEGYFVLVVTPEKVEKTKETSKMFDATFSILHDTNNKIMNDYKVAFDVNKQNVTNYFRFTRAKVAEYNDKNDNVLPVPATYIISQDGTISFVDYNPDYTKRFDVKKLVTK